MKCVQVVGQGIPHRMRDHDAAQLVAEGDAEYCSKSVWKEFHDNNADEAFRARRASHGRIG